MSHCCPGGLGRAGDGTRVGGHLVAIVGRFWDRRGVLGFRGAGLCRRPTPPGPARRRLRPPTVSITAALCLRVSPVRLGRPPGPHPRRRPPTPPPFFSSFKPWLQKREKRPTLIKKPQTNTPQPRP